MPGKKDRGPLFKSIPNKPNTIQPQAMNKDPTEPRKEQPDIPSPSFLPSLFMAAVEQAPVAISITDEHANIIYTNREFTRVTGYEKQEIIGRNESVLSHKVTPRAIYEDLWNHLTQQKTWHGILLNRRQNNDSYLADVTIAPVVSETQKVSYYIGMHRDITNMHRLERELQDHMMLADSLFNMAPVALALIDAQGRIVRENSAYMQLCQETDLNPASSIFESIDLPLEDWAHHKDRVPVKTLEVHLVSPKTNRSYWLNCIASTIDATASKPDTFFESETEDFMLLALHNITPLRRRQEELRLSALRANIMEHELSEGIREAMNGSLFHINELIGRISSILGLLQRRHQTQDENLIEALVIARQQGQNAVTKLQNALPPEKKKQKLPLNLNDLLRDILAIYTWKLLADGISIDWRPSSNLVTYFGDPTALQDLFKQLIENALEALEDVPPDDRNLLISTLQTEDTIEIVIRDSGCGISPTKHLDIFEPFTTTKSRHGHAGMGLVLVQNIINDHGGLIRVTPNSSEQGTTIQVILPLLQADHHADQ